MQLLWESEVIVQTPPFYAEMFKKKSVIIISMKLHICGNLSFEAKEAS